ncbi:MAG: DUF4010 domain-containing protein, partial [Holophagales bacterium]|nr:DUF4010 domain-containing protein [Holophagales bacterium]
LAVAWARDRLGSSGLYAVALLSGSTDMDAITLSTSRMVQDLRIDVETGWRLVLLASMSNLAFKLGIASLLGPRALGRRLAVFIGLALVAGAAIFFLWPTPAVA